ncbi:30002_t:CDS:2, partial [Racocetra persica]
ALGGKQVIYFESFKQIAKRETFEETGIEIPFSKLTEVIYSYYSEKNIEIKTFIYKNRTQYPQILKPENHTTWKFYTKKQVQQLPELTTIETLLKRLNPTNNYRLGLILVLLQVANKAADYITQPEREPRSFSKKTVLEQEETALQISDYFNYFEVTLSGICKHFDIENADNNYIPNPIGHILYK